MAMYRYRILWEGFTGAPGYTNLYTDATVFPLNAMSTWASTFVNYLPHGTTLTFPTTVDEIDETTGAILGTVTVDQDTAVTSAVASGPYAGASGGIVDWLSAGVRVAGRLVRGRSFIVPMDATAYDGTGKLRTDTQAAMQAGATAFITATSPHFVIWSRPYAGRSLPLPARPARAGSHHPVYAASVPIVQAQLRSRRT